jgi:hypothetical protein
VASPGAIHTEVSVAKTQEGIPGGVEAKEDLPQDPATECGSDTEEDIQRHTRAVANTGKDESTRDTGQPRLVPIVKDWVAHLRGATPTKNIGGDEVEDCSPAGGSQSPSGSLPLFLGGGRHGSHISHNALFAAESTLLAVTASAFLLTYCPSRCLMLLLRLVVDAFGEAILEDLPDGQGATLLNIYAIGLMLLSTLDLGPVDVLFEGDGGVDTGT